MVHKENFWQNSIEMNPKAQLHPNGKRKLILILAVLDTYIVDFWLLSWPAVHLVLYKKQIGNLLRSWEFLAFIVA